MKKDGLTSLFWHALDTCRGSLSIEEGLEFILQLLCWKVLSEKNHLAPSFTLAERSAQATYFYAMMDLAKLYPDLKEAFEPLRGELSESIVSECHSLVATQGVPELPTALNDFLISAQKLSAKSGFTAPSHTLIKMIAGLVSHEKNCTSVYLPFDYSLFLGLELASRGYQVFSEFLNIHTTRIALLFSTAFSLELRAKTGNPIPSPSWLDEEGKLIQFDLAVALPFLNMRYDRPVLSRDVHQRFREMSQNGNVLNIRHMMAHTRNRVMVVMSNALLFRAAGSDISLKSDLVSSGQLEKVVALPPGLYSSTSVPLSLLIVNSKKTKRQTVDFIDIERSGFWEQSSRHLAELTDVPKLVKSISKVTSECTFARSISPEAIADNGFDITPSRYVLSELESRISGTLSKAHTVKLEELVTFIRPQHIRPDNSAHTEEFAEASLSDIQESGILALPEKKLKLSGRAISAEKAQLIRPHDILLVIKGASTGSANLAPLSIDGRTLANQSLMILRLKSDLVTPVYLLRYLLSPVGQNLLDSHKGGSSVFTIQIRDLRALPVLLPDKSAVKKVEKSHSDIVSLYDEIKRLQVEAKDAAASVGALLLQAAVPDDAAPVSGLSS